ncbi:EAL domain-containing protein [Janthinobacterium lividum]|uniref:EAL domain-containing protein n=1 Tax=Janthinobacterium lividum TaxID=29581 RepID=UPI000874294D|nr:EAL domain-containing protein [Janthinobacterium lividum]MCC7716975.1 EAL domain-containing protein [Janthinobacterium lividum]WQE31923.1 EAL domain-containing protein [Janthinobacterium lividum]
MITSVNIQPSMMMDAGFPVLGGLGLPADQPPARLKEVGTSSGLRPLLPSDADAIHAVTCGLGLRMVYQPQYDLTTRRIVSAEALLRWHHPQYGDVSPSVLIPMVNRLGLHMLLFNFIVTRVIDVLYCQRHFHPQMSIAVNASIETLCTPELAPLLANRMARAGLSPRLLKIEMTEELPVLDELHLSACLHALRAKGFPLSLDDFGAGSATLNLLAKMPFDEVKIDGAFIRAMDSNPQSRAVVAAIIDMAQLLKLKLIAEGIESEAMIASLLRMGCDTGQGYVLSRPMERDHFLRQQIGNAVVSRLNVK